jgi:hypothetical protein
MEMYWLRKGRVVLIDPALVASESSQRKLLERGAPPSAHVGVRPPPGRPCASLKEDLTTEAPSAAATPERTAGRRGSPEQRGSPRSSRLRAGELREVLPGEAFGQEAMLFNMRQQWEARAITYCDLLYLSREAVEELSLALPHLSSELLALSQPAHAQVQG